MNESHVHGTFDETKGKLKQSFGEATGDQETANSGAVDQVKGSIEKGWGDVKDAVRNLTHSNAADSTRVDADRTRLHAEQDAHNTRNSIADGAENLKNSISRGLDHLTHKANT